MVCLIFYSFLFEINMDFYFEKNFLIIEIYLVLIICGSKLVLFIILILELYDVLF